MGDDILDSLFDNKKHPARQRAVRGGPLNRSSAADNIFSMLAEEVKRDGGDSELDSDVSAADPDDILKNLRDMDDMDADLFGSKKKTSSAPTQTKLLSNEGLKKDTLESNATPEGADEAPAGGKKTNSASLSTTRNYKKFTFSDTDGDEGFGQTPFDGADEDDPLADQLDDLLPDENKVESKASVQQPKPDKPVLSPSASPIIGKGAKKRGDFSFEDDKDDLMDALGFDSAKSNPKKRETGLWSNKERGEQPQRVRTKLDEILENLSSPRAVERPPTGERREQPQSQDKKPQEKTAGAKETLFESDLTFGSYQPTLGSTPEGRQSRRQSVRFSTEDVSVSTPEKKPKPTTPPSARPRGSADWLGLKGSEELGYLDDDARTKKAESPKVPSSPLQRRPSLTGGHVTPAAEEDTTAQAQSSSKQAKPEDTKSLKKEEDDDDWLAGALSRKKTHADVKPQEETTPDLLISKQVTVQNRETPASLHETSTGQSAAVRDERAMQDSIPTPQYSPNTDHMPTTPHFFPLASPAPHALGPYYTYETPPASVTTVSPPQPQAQPLPRHIATNRQSGALGGARQVSDEAMHQQPFGTALSAALCSSVGCVPLPNHIQSTSAAVAPQVTFPADSLQQLLLQQQLMQSQLLSLGGVGEMGATQRFREKEQQDLQALQARIIQLEGQIKSLQLEKEQSQMLLENVQQRHKQDVELMENAHKTRVKLLEESAAQRETRMRQEHDDLMERLTTVTQAAEQERAELQAQYQRKVAQAQQDRDREVERLRDLQRKSILEMKKDHEDQVQRLKRLKEEEIDAVTSATSQTRSLTVVIEQMEQFSSRLGELSSRVESTHEHTTHGLEQGARHRDEQLRIMQDRLAQQQKAMTDERAYLKEIISRMDTQLSEQQRQLEKERWKVTAEQAKAESTQRGLEEERRSLSMQISMEREELERAKSSLLEEQKTVMQHCAEERRKLAAEWSHFHTQEKQRHERAEREVSSLLEKREGSIISLAQEQADLKLRMADVKQRETVVARERENLEEAREEVDREKERLSSTALRLKSRVQEVEAFSKLAAEKYEEGEQALQLAKRLEAEQEGRLRNIHSQTERLRQQEQRMLQERMRFNQLQKETEWVRQEPSSSPVPLIVPPILPESAMHGSAMQGLEPLTTLNVPTPTLPSSQSMALQASLALWKYTAERDREYLQEEQIFLDNLKRRSYKSSFNTD